MRKRIIFFTLVMAVIVLFSAACGKTEQDADDGAQDAAGTQSQTEADSDSQGSQDDGYFISDGESNYSYEYSLSMDGVVVGDQEGFGATIKVWVKDKKMRMDMAAEGGAVSYYTDHDSNESYMYIQQQNTAMKSPLPESDENSDPFKLLDSIGKDELSEYKNLGKETVDGKQCVVLEGGSGSVLMRLYVWEEHGIVIKYESSVDEQKSVIEYKNLTVGDVTDEMVTLPEGAIILDMGM